MFSGSDTKETGAEGRGLSESRWHFMEGYCPENPADCGSSRAVNLNGGMKERCQMSNQEKFGLFKENIIKENEEKYGAEIREKYGDGEVDAANRKMLNMTEDEWAHFQKLEQEIKEYLKENVAAGAKPESEEGKTVVNLHKEWLCMTWKQYSVEAHKGVAAMYIADERFKEYYDREVPGCAEFLEAAVRHWADKC